MKTEPMRSAFEKWVSESPLEYDPARYPDDGEKYTWPGQYKNIAVQLAWQAWLEASLRKAKQ